MYRDKQARRQSLWHSRMCYSPGQIVRAIHPYKQDWQSQTELFPISFFFVASRSRSIRAAAGFPCSVQWTVKHMALLT